MGGGTLNSVVTVPAHRRSFARRVYPWRTDREEWIHNRRASNESTNFASKRIEEYREGVWRILCSDFFSTYVDPEAIVLDLGAGWGEFINNITARRKFAVDLNPGTAEHVSEGVTFLHQDCSRKWELNPRR